MLEDQTLDQHARDQIQGSGYARLGWCLTGKEEQLWLIVRLIINQSIINQYKDGVSKGGPRQSMCH